MVPSDWSTSGQRKCVGSWVLQFYPDQFEAKINITKPSWPNGLQTFHQFHNHLPRVCLDISNIVNSEELKPTILIHFKALFLNAALPFLTIRPAWHGWLSLRRGHRRRSRNSSDLAVPHPDPSLAVPALVPRRKMSHGENPTISPVLRIWSMRKMLNWRFLFQRNAINVFRFILAKLKIRNQKILHIHTYTFNP